MNHDIKLPTAWGSAINDTGDGHVDLYSKEQVIQIVESDRQQRGEPATPWRAQEAAIEAKALATAQEIALMWGEDRSQFVSRIQLAVLDAMEWVLAAQPAARLSQPQPAEPVGNVSKDSAIAHMRINLPEGTPIYVTPHHQQKPNGAAYEEGWTNALQGNNPRYRRQVRNEALDEAAKAVANHNLQGREWVRGSLFDTLANEAAARIRQLKSEPLKD